MGTHLGLQSAKSNHKTIDDLVEFHSIRRSWDLNEDAHKDNSNNRVEDMAMGVDGVAAKHIEEWSEVKDVEVDDVEEIEHTDNVSTRSDATIPSSPSISDFPDDASLPLTSDGSVEFVDEMNEVEEGEGSMGLKRKRPVEPGEIKSRWKVARREGELQSDDGSEIETDNGCKRSWSAAATRKLKKSAASVDFVTDERKKKTFEDKCLKLDCRAKFRYRGATWQVLHSRCLRWYRMSEPYNTTKFRKHLDTCKAQGEKPNLSITSFFKPEPPGANAEAKLTITTSGRKHIFVGGSASTPPSAKPPYTDNAIAAQTRPCRGISDAHNPLVSTYLSQSVVDGAGSISLQEATKKVYGSNIKYSELTKDQKETVDITQSHLRTWINNRGLRVVFSTNCEKFVGQDRPLETICCGCEKVLQSDAFKHALRVKPVPLEKMKFIPAKYRGPLEDLGVKYAGIRGLSELLQDVSSIFLFLFLRTLQLQLIYDRTHRPRCGYGLPVALSKANTTTKLSSSP